MIGWRPVLVTCLALGILAIAGFHTNGPDPTCKNADSLRSQGLLEDAHSAYVKLLGEHSTDPCVTKGLDLVIWTQCDRAAELVEPTPADAKKAYRAIATSTPVRAATACARLGLLRLAGKSPETSR